MKIGDFQNGISQLGKLEKSKWYSMDNLDIHSEVGIAKPNFAMASESVTPNEACFSAIDPNGTLYFFSKTSGKTWKRTTAGVYSLVNTNANSTGHRGCHYFNGLIWYWTATKLGYFNLVSTWTDSFATFANGNARGCAEINNTLLICDGRNIARIDSSNVFSASELTLPAQFKSTDIASLGDDALIGTYQSTENAFSRVYLWNTIDVSWTTTKHIFEIGVNCFMQLDDIVLAQCGTTGRFYYWNGAGMTYFGKIPGITTSLGEQMAVNYKGRLLYANATKIYSIHREDNRFVYAICGEYTCTGTIASLITQGSNLLASVGTGVDKLGTSYATATIESPEIQQKITNCKVGYDIYPEGIGIQTKIQNGSYGIAKTMKTNASEMEVYYDGSESDNSVFQAKITLTPSGANRPKIKYLTLI